LARPEAKFYFTSQWASGSGQRKRAHCRVASDSHIHAPPVVTFVLINQCKSWMAAIYCKPTNKKREINHEYSIIAANEEEFRYR